MAEVELSEAAKIPDGVRYGAERLVHDKYMGKACERTNLLWQTRHAAIFSETDFFN